MLIHATNITGEGASHVITSFLNALTEKDISDDIILYMPAIGPLKGYKPKLGVCRRYKRILPNSLSRLLECVFSKYLFESHESNIILGDIPMRGLRNQVVLVHQPNLIYPRINPLSDKRLLYRVYRYLFKANLKYVHRIVVQTQVMADALQKSYPASRGKISIIPQPVPEWFDSRSQSIKIVPESKLIMFYPAAGYPHKNHQFLSVLHNFLITKNIKADFEIWVTLMDDEYDNLKHIAFIRNLGRIAPKDVLSAYRESSCLLFLSKMESYGFPLVEALTLSLPILCADFPYSRWMCENEAYYFQSNNVDSFLLALASLREDIFSERKPAYQEVLKKFPDSWDSVATEFVRLTSTNV